MRRVQSIGAESGREDNQPGYNATRAESVGVVFEEPARLTPIDLDLVVFLTPGFQAGPKTLLRLSLDPGGGLAIEVLNNLKAFLHG